VIFQTSLNAWLNKVRPGNVQSDDRDGKLILPPVLNHSGRFPFPITKTLSSAQVLQAEDVQGSFMAHRFQALGAGGGLDPWVELPPGVWDIDFQMQLIQKGAVSDNTAFLDVLLNIVESGVTRNHVLGTVYGTLVAQYINRKFTLTVSKEMPTKFTFSQTVGLGTATSVANMSLMAFRII